MKIYFLSLMTGLVLSISVYGKVQDLYPFDNAEDTRRFNELTQEMRCLVCQNESLKASHAPLAADMRRVIYDKIKAGENNQAIIDYMKGRYGDFIQLSPPFKKKTYLLWLGPFVMLVTGLIMITMIIKHRSRING
jgi:cytochrome c-type biogenesis protein CcmH